MTDFTGQVAVVTGAGGGIGRAIALALASRGAVVCLIGRNRKALEEMGDHLIYEADLSRDEDLDNLKGHLLHDLPGIDLLVHSAGVQASGTFSESCVDTLDWQYRVNVRAPYVLTQALLPTLIARKGQIVFMNSSAGLTAKAKVGQYAATKHALKALADSLRDEVNTAGVRVLSVYPGRTASAMQAAIFKQEGREYHPERLMQPEDVADVVIHSLLLPRTAEVTDVHVRPFIKS
jgi:short-subunit dehydrogenase